MYRTAERKLKGFLKNVSSSVVQPKREVANSDLLDRISVCFYWIKSLAHTLKSKVEWRATRTPAVHYYQITSNFISEVAEAN